jgi:hypothetical protein
MEDFPSRQAIADCTRFDLSELFGRGVRFPGQVFNGVPARSRWPPAFPFILSIRYRVFGGSHS